MDELRLGIVGAGSLSSAKIYPCLHRLPVQLAAVCDLDRERAERNARKFGGQAVFTDHRAMLAEAELDAVIVCVGPEAHAELSIEIIRHGLPVYTEKPPAVSAQDARRVRDASEQYGRICMTGFKKRFAPAYRKARAAVLVAGFGDPELLSIDYCCGPGYRNDPAAPRSRFLLDFAIHIIDLSRYLFGEVAEVAARERNLSTYAVSLRFANGALGVLALSSHRDWAVPTEKVELTGGPGQFISIDNSVEMVRYDGARIADHHRPSFSTARGDSLAETGFAIELQEFVDAVRSGTEPESAIRSSYETMRLHDAIVVAARTGRSVELDGFPA
ncbi:MAG TPA: Gfo/Idh/MocA family oxidoreductase [Mycobacteriales bacterium]|nr:Gfo/Idh/MocA family oxidoreductase [Mycobacteriales bacterium]